MKAAGYQGDIVADLKNGKELNGKTYKVHLDGYDQTGGAQKQVRFQINLICPQKPK